MGTERLIGMLGPARAQLDGTGRGAGALTPQMVAAGLAKCKDPMGASLLQAKVSGQFQYLRLERDLHALLLVKAHREGWQVNKPRNLEGMSRQMLRMALAGFLTPEKCPRCHGRKMVRKRASGVEADCPRCNGTGDVSLTGRQMAAELGLTAPAWKKLWARRFHGVQAWLHELYGTAEADLKKALR